MRCTMDVKVVEKCLTGGFHTVRMDPPRIRFGSFPSAVGVIQVKRIDWGSDCQTFKTICSQILIFRLLSGAD